MQKYQSFQFIWLLIAILPPIMIWLFYAWAAQIGSNPIPLLAMLVLEAAFAFAFLLFHGLRVTVTEEQIELKFGIGLIRKTIQIADIESVTVVRNKWYYGLGIRLIPNGMLYNAHGLDAVELKFWKKKSVIRIGSAEPRRLKAEIEQRMKTLV